MTKAQKIQYELYNLINKPRGRFPRIVDRSMATTLTMKDLEDIDI